MKIELSLGWHFRVVSFRNTNITKAPFYHKDDDQRHTNKHAYKRIYIHNTNIMIHLVTAPLLSMLAFSALWRLQPFPSKFRYDQLLFLICFTTSYSLQWLIGYVTVGIWCFFSESLVVTTRHRCFTGCSPFGIYVGNWEEPLRKFSRSQMLQRLFVFWNFKCVPMNIAG